MGRIDFVQSISVCQLCSPGKRWRQKERLFIRHLAFNGVICLHLHGAQYLDYWRSSTRFSNVRKEVQTTASMSDMEPFVLLFNMCAQLLKSREF